jgi:N-acylglucosamine-6-phosphate 2-epimerase
MTAWTASLRGIVISCQAAADEPLHGAFYMAAMARAAAVGGAVGIRANGADDVRAICAEVTLPVIGIQKKDYPGFEVYITPTFEDARIVVEAGAKMVAIDATPRPRPGGMTLAELVSRIQRELGVPVMADLSCMDDAHAAEAAGCDILATTLSGYTTHGRAASPGPDLEFISLLAAFSQRPVIAEGRFQEPAQVTEAFERGAFAVVIGGAVTRPQEITRRFVASAQQAKRRTPDPL